MSEFQFAPEVAAALIKVREQVKKLPKNSENKFAGYDFVSVDAFYDAIGPLLCDAGLTLIADCVSGDLLHVGEKQGRDGIKQLFQLKERWAFWFVHSSGAMAGPYHRNVTVPAEGAQAHGSSESYATKQFLRGTFKIPTGDADDPDAQQAQTHAPEPKPQQKAPTKPQAPHAIAYGGENDVTNEDLTALGRKVYGAITQAQSSADVDKWLEINAEGLELLAAVSEDAHKKIMDHADKRKDALK